MNASAEMREQVRGAVENYCGHDWPDGKPLPEVCPECDKIVVSVMGRDASDSLSASTPPIADSTANRPLTPPLIELCQICAPNPCRGHTGQQVAESTPEEGTKRGAYDMRHKHCIFCGEEVPVPRPTSWSLVCGSPANTMQPDTTGKRYHAVIVGSSKNEVRAAAPPAGLPEVKEPPPQALAHSAYIGNNGAVLNVSDHVDLRQNSSLEARGSAEPSLDNCKPGAIMCVHPFHEPRPVAASGPEPDWDQMRATAELEAASSLSAKLNAPEKAAPMLSERINGLPEWARQYIHDIETRCDPAGDIRTIAELRDTIRALEAASPQAVKVTTQPAKLEISSELSRITVAQLASEEKEG